VSVEMKVTNDRYAVTQLTYALVNNRHLFCGGVRIDGNSYQLGTGPGQGDDLLRGCLGILGVSVRHGLHNDVRITANLDIADLYRSCEVCHESEKVVKRAAILAYFLRRIEREADDKKAYNGPVIIYRDCGSNHG